MIYKTLPKFSIVGLFLLFIPKLYAQNDTICKQIAVESVQWLQNEQGEKLYNLYTEAVSSKLSIETTNGLWAQLQKQYGDFHKIDTTAGGAYESNYIVDCILDFENGKLKYRLTFNNENKIAGIFFSPYANKKKGNKAEETDVFIEKKTSFNNDGINFPAMLCLPKQDIKAMVVFVHGSGPNDMDETIGPNKIFKQIAHELAKYGIGSLRYDKRTYLVKQGKIDINFHSDLEHIVVSDASGAVDFIASIESIKEKPIFVVGHSLGAYAAPLIAKQNNKVAGIVIMAGNSRPLEDLIVEQYKYLYERGGFSKAEKTEIKKIKQQAKNVKSLRKDIDKGKIKDLPLVNDTSFWLSLNAYNPIETAKYLYIPILNIHGSRDYQVPKEDFKKWYSESKRKIIIYSRLEKDGEPIKFKSNPVTFISYFGLNHLFIYGKGKSYPEEYNRQGNVSKLMISDMANWMLFNSSNKK